MEQELFISGYCRCLDGSRTVYLVTVDGKLDAVDCAYPSCPYAANCPIAQRIEAALR